MTVAALPEPKPSWPRSETCSMEEGNLEAGTAESSCVSDAADVVEPDLGSARFLLQRGLGTALACFTEQTTNQTCWTCSCSALVEKHKGLVQDD